MKIKKYKADSVREALLQVKTELGPDAVILKIHEPSSLMGKSEGVEVTAALDEDLIPPPEVPPVTPSENEKLSVHDSYNRKGVRPVSWKQAPETESSSSVVGLGGKVEITMKEIQNLRHDFQILREELKTGARSAVEGVPAILHPLAEGLEKTDVPRPMIQDLLAELMIRCPIAERDSSSLLKEMRQMLSEHIPVDSSILSLRQRPYVMMFLGPTGVGKSTTIAKLAGRELLQKDRMVGIVTTDCYRMGALEQMHLFAQAADIALETVFGPEDVQGAMERLRSCDLILVDTAGRSRSNQAHMNELKALVQAFAPDQLHLVLSMNTRDRDLVEAVEQFGVMGVDHLLFTKQDETYEQGSLYWLPVKTKLPVSFVCMGQKIPDDLQSAAGPELASWILGEVVV